MSDDLRNNELIASAVTGDSTALERLLLQHYSQLEQHIARKIPVTAQRQFGPEDILQDVFTQAFRDIGQYQHRGEVTFLAWLKAIADHRLTDALRKIRAKKRGGDFHQLTPNDMGMQSTVAQLVDLVCEESHNAVMSVSRHEAKSAIHVGVAALPEDQRNAVRAKFFEGKNVDEIAAELNKSPGAIRGLIHRAQKNLAEMMGRSSQWLSR